jgi:hypothetical protein
MANSTGCPAETETGTLNDAQCHRTGVPAESQISNPVKVAVGMSLNLIRFVFAAGPPDGADPKVALCGA